MSAGPDLQVDTEWIRRAAATLEEAGRRWSSAAPGAAPAPAGGALGDDAGSAAAARLVGLRCLQAQQAAQQLAAVAAGLSQKLVHSADTFDRTENGFRWPR